MVRSNTHSCVHNQQRQWPPPHLWAGSPRQPRPEEEVQRPAGRRCVFVCLGKLLVFLLGAVPAGRSRVIERSVSVRLRSCLMFNPPMEIGTTRFFGACFASRSPARTSPRPIQIKPCRPHRPRAWEAGGRELLALHTGSPLAPLVTDPRKKGQGSPATRKGQVQVCVQRGMAKGRSGLCVVRRRRRERGRRSHGRVTCAGRRAIA
jgi:hypothetical protein